MPALEDYYECLHHRKEVRSDIWPKCVEVNGWTQSHERVIRCSEERGELDNARNGF